MNEFRLNIVSGGFFSQCRQVLIALINYINTNRTFPLIVNQDDIFDKYNPNNSSDPMALFFKNKKAKISPDKYKKIKIPSHPSINFNSIQEVISIYFEPIDEIFFRKKNLIKKYFLKNLPKNYCAVYFRGTDKHKETGEINFREFIKMIEKIAKCDPNIIFIIQTDDMRFHKFIINFLNSRNLKTLFFEENYLLSGTDRGFHISKANGDRTIPSTNNPFGLGAETKLKNFNHIKTLFAIFLILSECKYLLCSDSSCSYWMEIIRNNPNNFYLYKNMSWLTSS